MSDGEAGSAEGRITSERIGRILAIGIDRPRKLNGFSPKMLVELAEAFTSLERDEAAWVGVLYAHGANFTAGLELDKVAPIMREQGGVFPPDTIDPLSLRPPIRSKPLVCAVQGICFTLGIELMLAADIVVAADDCRFAQIEIARGIMPAGGATVRMVERAGWGSSALSSHRRGVRRQRGLAVGPGAGGRTRRPAEGPGHGDCRCDRRAGAARRARIARLVADCHRPWSRSRLPRIQGPAGAAHGNLGRRRRGPIVPRAASGAIHRTLTFGAGKLGRC